VEIGRGLKAFLNLDIGLTRGQVPIPDGREAKNRQFQKMRRRLESSNGTAALPELSNEPASQTILKAGDRLSVFRNLLALLPPGKLLDLGCGHGKFSLIARELGWDVTAVDVRTERMPTTPGIDWVKSDARIFEIEPDRYDCICILGLFYHLELPDQLDLLTRCAGVPTIIDTHVALKQDHEERGYEGTLFKEAPGMSTEQHAATATASWGNKLSFWPTEESLLRMIWDSGFSYVFKQAPPYRPDRTFYLCFGRKGERVADPLGGDQSQWPENLVPPEKEIFPGKASDFEKVGQEFLRYFKELGELRSDAHVLDMGCGIGRMAIPLTQYLDHNGTYEGLDVVSRGIEWCREHITPRYPNFRFRLADVYNKRYNPKGRHRAQDYEFPYEDRAFNFVCLISVFIHMLPQDVDNYLSEVARVLKLGGRCLITYFLLNEESLKLLEKGQGVYNFEPNSGIYRVSDPQEPERAVAYDEKHILQLYEKHGLSPIASPAYGSWCGRKSFLSYQDVIVAVRN
jgi:SAM-dependent methyltransferase